MKQTPSKEFFSPGVTVDVVLFTIEDGELKILLIQRAGEPYKGAHAIPGGFIRRSETSRKTAERVMTKKTGIKNVYTEQLYTFDALDRDPRGQILSIAYIALVPRHKIHMHGHKQTEHPEFISVKDLPKLAFDHRTIITYALKRLADKILYTNIAYSLLPKLFTLSELQKTYEIVLQMKLDKRNFRKKFEQLGLLKASKKKVSGGRQRPALLYSFKRAFFQGLTKPIL